MVLLFRLVTETLVLLVAVLREVSQVAEELVIVEEVVEAVALGL